MRPHPDIGLMTSKAGHKPAADFLRGRIILRDKSFLISQYDFHLRLRNIDLWIASYLYTNHNIKQMFTRTYRRLVKGNQET